MMVSKTIIENLLFNEAYTRKTIAYIKPEYFQNIVENKLFLIINAYIKKYNAIPNISTLKINLDNLVGKNNINEKLYASCKEYIETLNNIEVYNLDWLVDTTEKFCQDRAIEIAIIKSVEIIDDKSGKLSRGEIPELLQKALAVSFDTHIGHDYLCDAEQRYDYYHNEQTHIPFNIAYLDKITKGGVIKKTLNCFIAPTGVGKSLVMCSMAANNLACGYNVLYITLEMAEEKIAERIDANLLNTPIDMIEQLPKDIYMSKIARIKEKTQSKLVIKEYPPGAAGVGQFRHLLHELKLKKNFVPDIIYIDYLNICCSSRVKMTHANNSYFYVKSIAEEIRGLAVEYNLPIITATQTNREGVDNSDFSMKETSESIGLPMTLDLLVGIISTDELEKLGQYLFKQLKNRYNDLNKFKKFFVGVDKPKMRLFDIEKQDDVDKIPDSMHVEGDDDTTIKVKFDKSILKNF